MPINPRLRRLQPSRIDLYLLGEVTGPFLGGIAFFCFIFLMFQLLRLADSFIVHGVSAWTLGKITLLMTLSFMPLALPVSFLIAVLVGFGRLSSDSELVAMKASGMSLGRLAAPVVAMAIVVSSLAMALNMEWVPWGERTLKNVFVKVSNTKVVSAIKEGTFTSGFFDLLIFADKVDTKTNQLKRVFIYDEREPKNPLTVVAQTGEVVTVKTGTELGSAAVLKLYNGSIHRNDSEQGSYQKIDFGEYKLFLKVDEGASTLVTKPQMIPYHELVRQIATSNPKTYHGAEMRGEYWRRVAIALSPILFVFLGIGFGTVRTRAVRAGAALVAFVVLLIFWTIQTLATLSVQRLMLPPWFAMQMANMVVAVAGWVSFRRSMW